MKKLFFVILFCLAAGFAKAQKNISLAGYTANPEVAGDSITLVWWEDFYSEKEMWRLPFHEQTQALSQGIGYFHFTISTSHPLYFSLGRKDKTGHFNALLDLYPAEPEDSILMVNAGKASTLFYGKRAGKYRCRSRLDAETLYARKLPDTTGQFAILHSFKNDLDATAYAWLQADILGQYYSSHPAKLPNNGLAISKNYCAALVQQAKRSIAPFSFIDSLRGALKDKVLTGFLAEHLPYLEDATGALQKALVQVQSASAKSVLENLLKEHTVGSAAFDFSLPAGDGQNVSLHDLSGKVVFLDFWYTGCSSCREYYRDVLSKTEEDFRDFTGVVFVTINIDENKASWLQTLQKGGYTSATAINLFTGGKADKHPVIDQYRVAGYPCSFLIDKHGKIFSSSEADLRGGGAARLNTLISQALAAP